MHDAIPSRILNGWLRLEEDLFHLQVLSYLSPQTPICRVQYTTPNPIVKEPMYAARGRQKSVRGKFQLGKLCIGQQFQLFDNTLRQLPQGSFVRHQVALHEPQFVDKPHPGAGVVEHHQHEFFMVKVHVQSSLSGFQLGYTPGHRTFP